MTKYKILFLDFDGTIVPNGTGINASERVTNALNEAVKSIPISMVTGASLSRLKSMIPGINFNYIGAFLSGAQIIDTASNKLIDEFALTSEQLNAAAKIASQLGKEFHIFQDGFTADGRSLGGGIDGVAATDLAVVHRAFAQIPDIFIHTGLTNVPNYFNVSIAHPSANKVQAVMKICNLLSIDPSESIGVGDGLNDIEFLKLCGYKVAMENAVKQIKMIADIVIPSVTKDGIAQFLEEKLPDLI